jgi:SNF2 family DNA or RNA helicase
MMTLPLHPYQEPAVEKFLSTGVLLVAFEMGLGKTPIAIACAEELLGCADITTALLVVPASLKYQWAQALVKFTDLPTQVIKLGGSQVTIPAEGCVIIDGPPAKRKAQLARAEGADYVIMSYETVLSDTRLVRRLKPGLVVLDEASAIKNFGAKRTLTIKRSLQSEYRLALTGTPVENKPEEAFSIMEWVNPAVLGSFDLFEKTYIARRPNGTVRKYKNMPLLNHKLGAAMVRRARTDPDVASYLPEVDHGQWYVPLDARTGAAYQALAGDLLDALVAARGQSGFDLAAYYAGAQYSEATTLGRVMARQQAIELLLDHPALLLRSAQNYLQFAGQDGTWPGSKYCFEASRDGKTAGAGTPKLDFLRAKLAEILPFPENKVLIFSQHPEMLEIIKKEMPGTGCVLYHGMLSAAQKAAAIQRFTADAGCRLFLSSHAGAYGTDMRMANYLINYDLPWSGGTWDQINGRHQRVSSEFGKVFIRDIVMAGTTEVRKLAVLQYKLKVARAVVDGHVSRSGRIDNDLTSLTDFLQSDTVRV